MTKLITLDNLEQILPKVSKNTLNLYLEPLNIALNKYKINTKLRISAFLAQILYESGDLMFVEEIASGSAYEYREDLGNLEFEALQIAHEHGTTTGKFYKGRGLIMITGYYNYKSCGEGLELDLIHKPELLLEPINACLSSGWYWNTHNCNNLADVGLFGAITKKINGGFSGAAKRAQNYGKIKKILGI